MKFLIGLIFLSTTVFGTPSSSRVTPTVYLKNGTSLLLVPSSGNDTLVGQSTAATLSNKSISGASNTITGLTNSAISATAVIDFSKLAALPSGNILVGSAGNVATSVTPTGDIGITNAGVTSYSGVVPILKGGTGQTTKAASFDALSPLNAGGQILIGGASGTGTALANGTSGQALIAAGGTSAPVWTTLTAPSVQYFTTTPSPITGYIVQVSGISVTPTTGATYTNNGVTYTVVKLNNDQGRLLLSVSGAQTFSGTTLTKASGTGDATITFVNTATQTATVPQPVGTYTTPAGTKFLEVILGGGGGSGGGGATAASSASAGGGGGGGGVVYKWIANPSATYYYSSSTFQSANSAGNNAGFAGFEAMFGDSSALYEAQGGGGGYGCAAGTTPIFGRPGAGWNAAANGSGDLVLAGGTGTAGVVLSGTASYGGCGGTNALNTMQCQTQIVNANGFLVAGAYGVGGSGGQTMNGGSATSGGAGGNATVMVKAFSQ